MKTRSLSFFVLSAMIIMLISSCRRENNTIENDPLAGEYISGYTSGQISRSSQIIIKFTSAPVTEEEAGSLADPGIFSISPAAEGQLLWSDASSLVFTPSEKLEWGKVYKVKLRLDRIFKERVKARDFSFSVFTPDKDFTVDVSGLVMSDNDNTRYMLPGELNTSGEFDISEAEGIISAGQSGNDLEISWQHDPLQHKHKFTVSGIERGEEEREMVLRWDGKKAGIQKSGEEKIRIPSLKDFQVLSSRVISSPAQYLVIEFSDMISRSSELAGMVVIEGSGISKTESENNMLRVFPSSRLAGSYKVTVDGSLTNVSGFRMGESSVLFADFGGVKPAVRLPGRGVIVPTGQGLIFPFEAVNLDAVDVRITEIFSNNIHDFLQDNEMDGQWRLNYVGRTIRRSKVDLVSEKLTDYGQWNYFTIDLNDMIDVEAGAIYRVEIGFRKSYSLYPCESSGKTDEHYYPLADEKDNTLTSYNNVFYSNYYDWQLRDDPCSQAYYSPGRFVQRNILGSDFGIIAKRDANKRMNIIVTNLVSAMPEADVLVEAYDFQEQLITTVRTGRDGFAAYDSDRNTFLLVARKNSNTGYLKTNDGGSLSLSNFDVSGRKTSEGLKAYIFGERGVWRPGDSVFVALILEDGQGWIPEGHPIVMEVRDARGQIAERINRTKTDRMIYPFYFKTGEDDPTGNWNVTVRIGGTEFTKGIRIETVKPNRLKTELEFDSDMLTGNTSHRAELLARWLHGTPASGMKARVTASYRDIKTGFASYSDYVFDAPFGENYYPEADVFEGNLDENGEAVVNFSFRPNSEINTMLSATFITRVFEPGGDFSINRFTKTISPFSTYAGLRIPWSDPGQKKLNTGDDHRFDVITVDEKGSPVSSRGIGIRVYKLEWRYWWSRSDENLASYAGRTYHDPVYTSTIATTDEGRGSFTLNIPKSRWGRYLVLVSLPSGNTAGSVVYFDWPGGRDQSAGGAEVLMVSTDREKYNTGDKVTVSFPAGISSRALVSLENGAKVLRQEWLENISENTVYEFIADSDMSPNVYIHVSLLNPYSETANDLPVRMYGIAPVAVEDPDSHLEPLIDMPDRLRPEKEFRLRISEAQGREMEYYFALVDEGLLDLTAYKTPDPWPDFYSKEALGVKTWDMFRYVLGAYGGELEKMFAIGGDEAALDPSKNKARRFEPVVKVLGPYRLEKGKTAEHRILMPQYVGSVRAMLVAASGNAYGSSDKTVPVSNPVMVLGTLPRVLGPGESIKIPVSVFAMEEGMKRVEVEVGTNELLTATGPTSKIVKVDETGEYDIEFDYTVAPRTGQAVVNIMARSGNEYAAHEIFVEVRNPNPPETKSVFRQIKEGETWNMEVEKTGIEGTNSAKLEISGMLPLNMDKRLDYLIRYPHGCIEQSVSAVFPQLFIGRLTEQAAGRKKETDMNIKDGIDKMRRYQLSSGGMSFWPGSGYVSEWGSVYAAHFLTEARRAGYTVPASVMNQLITYLRSAAASYSYDEKKKYMQVTQAYRLFVLSEAGEPLTGAMNRLRERGTDLDMTALWFLAGSYALAGRDEVAYELIDLRRLIPATSYRQNFGTPERNMAVVLKVLSLLDEKEHAFQLAGKLSELLSSQEWLSTQTTAWSLVALSSFLDEQEPQGALRYSLSVNGDKENYISENAINNYDLLFGEGDKINVELENTGSGSLYAGLTQKGTPLEYSKVPEERGMELSVRYINRDGSSVEPRSLSQGSDFIAMVSVKNTGLTGADDIALSQIFPSGWEIMNTRLFGNTGDGETSTYDYRDIRDDRVYTYFSLDVGEIKHFKVNLTAAYEGEYILPAVVCEAMYDNSFYAKTEGMSVKVTK